MPRFSVAFSGKRKSAADDFENVPITTTEHSTFRVIERPDASNGRSFDGGARMARGSRTIIPKPNLADLTMEDNMFADLKANRGSGLSNTTNATSTDNSSRHSNASTAPSSTDLGGGAGLDDCRPPANQPPQPPLESPGRTASKSSFLDRATRTFSFGGQKKHSVPPPKESRIPIPDLPPVLTLQGDNAESRSRGMTASTVSTATPTKTDAPGLDLGGDFGSMFTTFEKRSSMATVKNDDAVEPRSLTGIRHVHPAPISPDIETPAEPLLGRRGSLPRADSLPAAFDAPPPVPRHQTLGSFKYSDRPSDIVEDEDAKLLQESFAAMKFLSDPNAKMARSQAAHRYRRDEDTFAAPPTKSVAASMAKEDNMFEGSLSRISRGSHRFASRDVNPSLRNKVMTPAEFERYRQDKERQDSTRTTANETAVKDDDDDDINYDDDDDEQERSKLQARQRRKQEAHMAVYRQQMMKVTGETPSVPVSRSSRSGLLPSPSAPQLTTHAAAKAPSPDPAAGGADDEDEDEDVPLGILQAHGFPAKNRPPTRLSHAGSISNLRASTQGPPPGRPASVAGEAPSSGAARRPSTLPAFARNLPQDPFVGASIVRPALRESLSFGDAGQLSQQQAPLPPGGLVGVIASEERSRALRRGSPNIDTHKLSSIGMGMNGPHAPGFDPIAGIPHHMMYNAGGMPAMPPMPPPPQMLTPGDQAQIQMTQQMQQFMQMQMQFMHMMATNQGGAGHPMQPPMQPPYAAGPAGNLSVADLSSRHSMMGEPMADPHRMEPGMRTMSMVQSSSMPLLQQMHNPSPALGPAAGYTPSIAPSERSNVGLPGRYRTVSQAPPTPAPGRGHYRASTMSGRLSHWSDDKSKSTVKILGRAGDGSSEEDDEEQAWAAMKAKREKKKSIWRSKKSLSSELAL
ncbi:hypothetical protein CDD83_10328 [Cordyceps sp. RAO-2017]|nr:hypothetical protein CDD83_10328 [Cordyceps sp. RAO-2017]